MENVFIPLLIICVAIFALVKVMNNILSFGKSFFNKTNETVKNIENEKVSNKSITKQIIRAIENDGKKGTSIGDALKLAVILLAVFILLCALFPKVFGWILLLPLIFIN